MTNYTDLMPLVKTIVGDQSGEVYPESDITLALKSAYRYLLFLGFQGTYVVGDTGITPDLQDKEAVLFCAAAACLLLGGKLADPSLAMEVKSEDSVYKGIGGARALEKRLADLRDTLQKAINDDTPAAIGHLEDMGLVLPSDSPYRGFWPGGN